MNIKSHRYIDSQIKIFCIQIHTYTNLKTKYLQINRFIDKKKRCVYIDSYVYKLQEVKIYRYLVSQINKCQDPTVGSRKDSDRRGFSAGTWLLCLVISSSIFTALLFFLFLDLLNRQNFINFLISIPYLFYSQ